jgi:uncharacterized protein YecT (DUF1311 family)
MNYNKNHITSLPSQSQVFLHLSSSMKNIILTLSLFVFCFTAKAQLSLTPAQNSTIDKTVQKQLAEYKARLLTQKDPQILIEFKTDTFKVEHIMSERLQIVFSTADMSNTAYDAAKAYDALLNKYYKKLLGVLKDTDKQTLIQAQKSWLAYRDNELKLIGLIGTSKYTGGTIQGNINASWYLELIKDRTVALFQHYARIDDK